MPPSLMRVSGLINRMAQESVEGRNLSQLHCSTNSTIQILMTLAEKGRSFVINPYEGRGLKLPALYVDQV